MARKATERDPSPITPHPSRDVSAGPLRDVQKSRDFRKLAINKVGVKDISYPITVMDKNNAFQHTVARVNMYVDLPHHFKGTHMSRFVEILNAHRKDMALDKMEATLQKIKERLGASSAHLEMEFPYFIEKRAPVSGARSLMEYTCRFLASLSDQFDFVLEMRVPVTSLCPCSKDLSRFGAHNQRGIITVQVRYHEFVWIEDLVTAIEECGSSPVYSLLKREDEQFVTERAYENPRFVEDMVREAALRLLKMENVTWFSVSAENFESIHNHSAYASIEMDKRKTTHGASDCG